MKIITSIASTTHIDRHNERMAKSALNNMAEQIKERFIPQLVEHDPNQHIGEILYGEVFQLKDGEYALGVVLGIFENNKEKETFKTGQPNNVWQDYKKYLDIDELLKLNEQNHRFIASTGDLRIVVYPKDHSPQHFHVISKQRKIDARFDIATLNLINAKQGSIQEKDIKKIQNFFKTFPDCLKKLRNEHARMR